jgi:hypothetical protein
MSNKRKLVPQAENEALLKGKCAKIAAKVPARASSAPATITYPRARLDPQMLRDSGVPGQQSKSNVIPSTNTIPKNDEVPAQNVPCGHSSSPDPNCSQEITITVEIKEHLCKRRSKDGVRTFTFAVM